MGAPGRRPPRKRSNLELTRRVLHDVWAHPNNRPARGRAVARALGWQVRKRALRRPIERSYLGTLRLRIHPDSGSGSNVVYFGDRYDRDEMAFVERYLRPGDGFIDAGANIGTYSLLASTCVGPLGHVDAFEPVPRLAAMLRENVALNHLGDVVHVHEVALSDRDGTAEFIDLDVSSSFAVAGRDYSARSFEVCVQRLDDAVPPDRRYALGKLDVEGAEHAAFVGMATHLAERNPPVWLVELLPNQLDRLGASSDQLATLLDEAGYELATYDADEGRLELVAADDVAGNVLAIARDALSMVRERLAPG